MSEKVVLHDPLTQQQPQQQQEQEQEQQQQHQQQQQQQQNMRVGCRSLLKSVLDMFGT